MTIREATVRRLRTERNEARAQVRDIEFQMDVLGKTGLEDQLVAADEKLATLEDELKYHESIALAEAAGWTKQA